jgi:hypothetical protein
MKSTTNIILILNIIGQLNHKISYGEYALICYDENINSPEFTNFHLIFGEVLKYSKYYTK